MTERERPRRHSTFDVTGFTNELSAIGKQVAVKDFWGLPLFLALFAVTFTLFVLLLSIYESMGANILPFAGVFIFLSAIFWILDPILKERFPTYAANLILVFLYLTAAQVLLMVSGGFESPLFVVYSFVVFTGAFSYGLTGSLMVTLLIAAAYSTFVESVEELPTYFIRIITLWIVALMVGFLAEMKRRVERRETLQNMRLTALTEIARFMRELSRPEDVIEAGLEALMRLMDAGGAALRRDGVVEHRVGTVDFGAPDDLEYVPFELGGARREESRPPAHVRDVVISRRGRPFSADEDRIAGLLVEKMFLIWSNLADRSVIENIRAEKERVLDSIGTAVVTLTDDGMIQTLNRRAGALLELAGVGEFGVNAMVEPYGFPDPSSFGDVSREVEIRNASGERIPVEMRVFRAKSEKGVDTGWIVVFDDLKELRRLSAMMRRSEALAAVGEMAARVAHEIRNPLGGILGFLGLAEHKGSGEILRYIRQSKAAVMRLEALVRDLLSFARPIPLEHGSFMLADFWSMIEAAEAAKDSVELAKPRATIEPLPPSLAKAVLKGDSILFQQVTENILRNAKEAAGERGNVSMRVRDGDPFVWIEVDDDGKGWSGEHADKMFEPFFSTKETGSGLGLAIARRIVEQLGGSIKPVRMEKGGSMITRFRISWPKE